MNFANKQTFTQAVYFNGERYKALSIDTQRGSSEPQKAGIRFYIFTSTDLYSLGWLMTLINVIFDQSL